MINSIIKILKILILSPLALFSFALFLALMLFNVVHMLILKICKRTKETKLKGEDKLFFIIFSHVNWEHIWQRNHHTVYRISLQYPCIFFEPVSIFDFYKHPFRYIKKRIEYYSNNLIIYRPITMVYENVFLFINRLNELELILALKIKLIKFGFRNIILWFYYPQLQNITEKIKNNLIVYDIQDEYSKFIWCRRDITEREITLLKTADLVFTGTLALYRRKKKFVPHDNVYFFPCGVEYYHFAQAREHKLSVPEDIKNISRPCLGYFGSIEERIDFELLEYIARQRPRISILMIGPYWRVDQKYLDIPNIYFLGKKDYKELPNYIQNFDICLMPFALNELTMHINPTKLLEYFSAGKPVISTAIPDVVELYSDYLYIANNKEECLSYVDKILRGDYAFDLKKVSELARRNSWESMVEKMMEHIKRRLKETSNES